MGPIVVSVDESGSMTGEKIEAAKGLALAMASIARAQKRPFLLCAWADQPEGGIRTASGSADAIVEWLEGFFGGGTDLDGPLHTLPTTAWPPVRSARGPTTSSSPTTTSGCPTICSNHIARGRSTWACAPSVSESASPHHHARALLRRRRLVGSLT
jgi:hypothetical protein